jgi:adenylyltransferase/sulfurtransferase
MTPEQQERYSRHTNLKEIGVQGQQALLDSTALIVGLGGLGSPAAMYLAAAGVGRLIFADFDVVEISNLQRQIAHNSHRVGELKSHSARETCLALNPDITIDTVDAVLDAELLDELLPQCDVVLEGSDNFPTRYAVNAACVKHQVPLVSGAAIRFDGQVSVFAGHQADAPCYRCLYSADSETAADTCALTGVLSPVVGMIGTVQAAEAIKVLAGFGKTLQGRLLLLDGLSMEWREIGLRKNPKCPCCGQA